MMFSKKSFVFWRQFATTSSRKKEEMTENIEWASLVSGKKVTTSESEDYFVTIDPSFGKIIANFPCNKVDGRYVIKLSDIKGKEAIEDLYAARFGVSINENNNSDRAFSFLGKHKGGIVVH